MRDEGWTWSDLAGELMERGIDPDDVGYEEIAGLLNHQQPEQAADALLHRREAKP